MDPQPTVYAYTTAAATRLSVGCPRLPHIPSLHSWWVPLRGVTSCSTRSRPVVLYLRPVLTVACCCLSYQRMVVCVLCPISFHIVYALCLATAGLRVSQDSVYPCILLSGPTPTLAANLTTVFHSRKVATFLATFFHTL